MLKSTRLLRTIFKPIFNKLENLEEINEFLDIRPIKVEPIGHKKPKQMRNKQLRIRL